MNKKSTPFQLILLGIFGALAVAGVLVFALAVSRSTGNSVGEIKIWGTLDQGAFSTVLRQAAENDPTLAQVTYEQKDPATYEQDLTNALASGAGPDLFLLRGDYAMHDAGKVVIIPDTSLSVQQFQTAFIDAANVYLSPEGVIGVPILVDPLILFWNRDLLASGGYANPPRLWSEVSPMVQKLTKRDDAGSIQQSGIAFGEYKNVNDAKDILALLIMQAGGVITTRDTQGNLIPAIASRSVGSSKASENALAFYTEFANPSRDDYSWNRSLPDAQDAFASGDAALYVGFASEQALIARKNPNLNFAAAPIPQLSDKVAAVGGGRTYALAVSRTGKHPDAALTVAYALAGATAAKSLSIALGIPPARRDLLAQPGNGEDALPYRQTIIARGWVDPDPTATADVFRGMIEDTVSGATTLSEAVQRADQQLAHIIGL